MGCILSRENIQSTDGSSESEVKSRRLKKKRGRISRISVAIKVGTGIRRSRVHATTRKIVCIFGGPKSGKGAVIEELVESFGVRVISAEQLIRTALRKKLDTKIDNGAAMMDSALMLSHIRTQPDLVKSEWIFDLIRAEVLKFPDSVHVIDLLPNSKVILRNKMLFDNAAELLAKFEENCPIAFAMHLYIDKENLNKQLDSAAQLKAPDGCTDPGALKDEADSAATKRRHEFYEQALKTVKKYFKESDRLVEVDVSSMSHERIWYKIVRMFATFDLSERQNNSLIILFASDLSSLQPLMDRHVKVVRIAEVVEDADAPFESLLQCLQSRVTQLGCPNVCYIADIRGTSLERAEENEPKKHLIYQLMEEDHLSHHLNKYQRNMLAESDSPQSKDWDTPLYFGYKAPNNLTLLFPDTFSRSGAEVIATTYCYLDTNSGG